ncbi:ubiquitin-like small modifier protein 1 [Methanofollis fontis]|uniref:ubiquitin-like small modifier protein 1 n=1 Tax=Methanofollis fontis TaxID=2052832 RepID=UPI0022876D92|nr:ubiquitin-like small modifier protein 1 [Methanofollis fontis]
MRAFATFRKVLSVEQDVDLPDGSTVGDLVVMLTVAHAGLTDALFSAPGVLRDHVNILRNGRNIHFEEGLGTLLRNNDVVALFPPVGGG